MEDGGGCGTLDTSQEVGEACGSRNVKRKVLIPLSDNGALKSLEKYFKESLLTPLFFEGYGNPMEIKKEDELLESVRLSRTQLGHDSGLERRQFGVITALVQERTFTVTVAWLDGGQL
ncbi:hypothetical protein VNO78_33183 [Psophocarpus tetragonolobus]|uniref:Uncharacterized protein n=1 Tax=Psophocarpus tetragonolobus TaxID=3891 RepID=A0AAN9P1P8_PSOTE